MTRASAVVRVVLALVATALLAGCSTVPTASPAVPVTQAPSPTRNDVGIEPLSPPPGATPEEVVRGFIEAAASTVRGHPVAREHLAPEVAQTWSDEAGITVISSDYSTAITAPGTVEVSAALLGNVDQRGVFTVGDQQTYTRSYGLEQVDGEWRVTNPPDGLVILQPDFTRLYDDLDAFFPDPTGTRLVPDPRYLIGGTAQPTALVDRLLAGPSSSLASGVQNPLAGASLKRAVQVTAAGATVDLTRLADASEAELARLCAQLVWTLVQVDVRSVTVLVDGQPVALPGVPAAQTVDDWASYDPDASPVDAVGHYLEAGALRSAVTGQPAPGPAGTGVYGLSSATIAVDGRTGELSALAGVTGAPGTQSLLLGTYGGDLAPVLGGRTFTAPTVAATRGEVWTVRDGTQVVRVASGGGQSQEVTASTLAPLGPALALKLSPDGVRAAIVVDAARGRTLVVGTVVRGSDGRVELRDLRSITPSLSQVSDVAWRDTGRLLVLAGDPTEGRVTPYSVGVDGWGLAAVSTSGLPGQPTSVAGAPGRPALVAAGGTLWQLVGGTWTTLIRGAEPLAGTAPFYPF